MANKEQKPKRSLKQKMQEWYHSKSKKSLILSAIFLFALPIAGGVVSGIVISKFFIGKTTDYTNIDANALVEKNTTKLTKYEDCIKNNTEFLEVLKPYEMVNIGYELFSKYEHSKSITIGNAVAAVVNQSIRASSFRNGNEYLEESISKSNFVSLAARTYLHEDTNLEFLDGSATSSNTASWPDEHYNFTTEEYADAFGKTPSTPLIYIVGKKTIISSGCSATKTDNGYRVELTLNPVNSVVNYVKQMKSLSKLADYPSFESVHTVFYLNNDLLVNKLEVEEKYYAKTGGVGADITANLTIYYEVDEGITVPSLNTPVNYGDYEK